MSTSLTILPSPEEAALARKSSRELSAFLSAHKPIQQLSITDTTGATHTVEVPVTALRLLAESLACLGDGHGVNLAPVSAELTTQEAADILQMSRPTCIKLLETGAIAYHRVGNRRKVRYADVVEYKTTQEAKRRDALEQLSALDQELGLGY